MARMTGGRAVARALRAEGVEVVFGIVGTHNVQIFDGLYDEPDLRVVTTRHEQGAGFMADGYARATGRIAACVVVPGPGLTNAMTAIGQAYSDSVPLLAITGQNPTDRLDRALEDFHELRDSVRIAGAVTASAARVTDAAGIPAAVHEAVRVMRSRRPRPTFLEVPMDVLAGEAEVEMLQPAEDFPRASGSPEAVARAATLLKSARRPIVIAGGGVISAEGGAALRGVAERLGAPVITTCHGKGAIPDDHPLALGDGWGRLKFFDELFAEADACLAVGTRFDVVTDYRQGAGLPDPLVHVDIDPAVINQLRPSSVGIVGDARLVLERLADELGGTPAATSWCDVAAVRAQKRAQIEELAGPVLGMLDALRAAIPRDAIVVDDLCLPGYWAVPALEVYEPRTFLHPGTYGTLGFALPAAIGAQLGRPDRWAVSLSGDGGFLYTSQELATAVQQGLNLIAIVFNDNAYGALRLFQDRHYKGRQIGVELRNPDFGLLGQAYGAHGVKLRDHEELGPAVADAIARGGPTVIECPLSPDVAKTNPPWMP